MTASSRRRRPLSAAIADIDLQPLALRLRKSADRAALLRSRRLLTEDLADCWDGTFTRLGTSAADPVAADELVVMLAEIAEAYERDAEISTRRDWRPVADVRGRLYKAAASAARRRLGHFQQG